MDSDDLAQRYEDSLVAFDRLKVQLDELKLELHELEAVNAVLRRSNEELSYALTRAKELQTGAEESAARAISRVVRGPNDRCALPYPDAPECTCDRVRGHQEDHGNLSGLRWTNAAPCYPCGGAAIVPGPNEYEAMPCPECVWGGR